jgi:hypothetical protein
VLALIGACDPGSEDRACESPVAEGDPVPIAVDCSFSFDGIQTDVTYEPSETRTETLVGGKLIAAAMLFDDEFEGRSFSVIIRAEDARVGSVALYQMRRDELPQNEFYGDHGFTGLNWVKDPDADENVQYACFARYPHSPPHFWTD